MARIQFTTLLKRNKHGRADNSRIFGINIGRVILAASTIALLSVLMSIHFLPDRVTLKLGDRIPNEIRATRTVSFVDTEATLRARQGAALRVPLSYDMDRTALAQASRTITEVFDQVATMRKRADRLTAKDRSYQLADTLGNMITPEQARYLLSSPETTVTRLESTCRQLTEDIMSREIRNNTDDLAHAKSEFEMNARRTVAAPNDISVLRAVGEQALRANQIYNRKRTDLARERATVSVEPIRDRVREGEVVARPGEVFTQLHLDKCSALGLISPRLDLVTGISLVALATAIVLLVGLFVRRNHPDIYDSPKLLHLLAATVVSSVFGLKLFGAFLGLSFSGAQFGYIGALMVVAAGMVITVLLSAPLAVLVTALLSVLSGLIMNHELRFSVIALVSGLVSIYCAPNIRNRRQLLQTTAAIAMSNLAMVWILGAILGDTLAEVIRGSAWAIAAAGVAVLIFFFAVAMLEKPFGILTPVWLLELSASEHPLLRRLCLNAPGTYAHSVMVGNLAEAAAEAIGADPLFCRVASYYHDVGKMQRPECFIENQHGINIHDRLNPSLSALIIAAHVKDGLELADQYGLPKQIKAVIEEHQGNSLIRYFYHQALLANGELRGDPVLEQRFRYDGPCPQTRESGIIMLADTVEASARALDRRNIAAIQALVENQIQAKIADGQLDDCDLTFKDVSKIQAAFVRVLSAMMHGRVDYPELSKERVDKRGSCEAKLSETYANLDNELTEPTHSDETPASGRPFGPSN